MRSFAVLLAQGREVSLNFDIPAVLALVAGILILIRPRLLAYIVAIYLIIIGILGLLGQ